MMRTGCFSNDRRSTATITTARRLDGTTTSVTVSLLALPEGQEITFQASVVASSPRAVLIVIVPS